MFAFLVVMVAGYMWYRKRDQEVALTSKRTIEGDSDVRPSEKVIRKEELAVNTGRVYSTYPKPSSLAPRLDAAIAFNHTGTTPYLPGEEDTDAVQRTKILNISNRFHYG